MKTTSREEHASMRGNVVMSTETKRFDALHNKWQGVALLSLVPGLLFLLVVGDGRLHDR